MSSREQHGWDLEATSADDGGGGRDEQVLEASPYGMSLISNQVNMTNCYKQCKRFFEIYESIHFKVLIAYWIMAGYLGDGFRSIGAAYEKGFNILFDLVHKDKILKLSDPGMIEFAESSNCRHPGSCFGMELLGFVGSVCNVLGTIAKVVLSEDEMLSLNEKGSKMRFKDEMLSPLISQKVAGLSKYFAAFNPTPDSLNALLLNVKNPSMLLLRGFQELSLPSDGFLLDGRGCLTHLEISGSTRLATIPLYTISLLSDLRYLNLSDLPIEELPSSFFQDLRYLRWLILRGCCKLLVLDFTYVNIGMLEVLDLSHCTSLQKLVLDPPVLQLPSFFEHELWVLDLSYTPLDPLPLISSMSTSSITHLYLRGSKLEYLSFIPKSFRVQVLDLSGSSWFTKLDEVLLNDMPKLVKLDLSWTKVKHLPSLVKHICLRALSLRGLELDSLETLSSLPNQLIELDLTSLRISSSQEFKLDFLQSLEHLQFLNLSQTSVAKLPDMSKLVTLKELLLVNCQYLNLVPDLQALTNLEALDLSLPNDSSSNNRQLEIETKGYLSSSFLVPKSIKKLILTNRSGVQKLFPLTTLGNLNLEILDLRGTDVTDWESKLEPQQQPQERIPKPIEIHIVSLNDESSCQQPNQPSSSGDVEKIFTMLISDIQKNLNYGMAQEQVERLHHDLRYIQENYDWLRTSSNWKSGQELWQELMNAATDLSTPDFALDSASIKQLLRIVVKLKLLVPHKHIDKSEALEVKKQKKKTPLFGRSQSQDNDVMTEIARGMQGMELHLLSSYKSLSAIQKNCLLCFSIFPSNEGRDKNTGLLKSLVIKKKILIYWWVGEGFIDLQNPDPNLSTTTNRDQEMMVSREIETGRDEGIEQFTTTKGVKKPKTTEEIGKQILKVLVEKGFIEPVMKKGQESGSCCIHPFVHCFVIQQAKEEDFFDFDKKTSKLIPTFTRSRRACLLSPHDSVPSSCELWANYSSKPNKLKSFETVKTLFNVNESVIDIKQEWFSKMKNLYVLHLGIWGSENTDLIEVSDQKFLEDLKKMKQLRVLSLQGLPTIMKLTDSICHLKNLIILDLKDCSYLEELPADIGSLKCLTHLDISSCPLLYKLPTGISLLSKLEVLRGFVISEQQAARDTGNTKLCGVFHRKKNDACTFKDLLKLDRLRDLSIIVNIDNFPEDRDLKVFKEMEKLCKLKILWKRSISSEDITSAVGQELSVRSSRWQSNLTCWKRQQCQNRDEEDDTEESNPLESIEKLELWCFPYENAPHWMNPIQLKNLKKLYIMGGNLRKLPTWNIETLRLKHLRNLDIQWPEMKIMFPKLKYLEMFQCARHDFFPCNSEGVWKPES